MPVLVEGATWVARARTLEERLAGGAEAFAARGPPGRSCSDGELVAISFGSPAESRAAWRGLQGRGLQLFREDGAFADLALVHHRIGLPDWCPWLELAAVALPSGGRVLAARAAGSTGTAVALPPGWGFEGSATAREGVAALRPADRPLRFVRRAPDAAVYEDRFTGEAVSVPLPPPVRVAVETAAARHEVEADVARRPAVIELGLMHRASLAADAGMLFDFGEEDWRHFWMKNTLVPLDLVFARADGAVVNVVEGARPLSLEGGCSEAPCALVLEVNAGWAAARGVGAGARLTVVPGARPVT